MIISKKDDCIFFIAVISTEGGCFGSLINEENVEYESKHSEHKGEL